MKIYAAIVSGVLAAGLLWAADSNPTRVNFKVERLDPAVNEIVPMDPVLEKVVTSKDFQWTEGPVWISSGYLLFAEIPSNSIRKWVPGQGVSVFLQPSGWKEVDALHRS